MEDSCALGDCPGGYEGRWLCATEADWQSPDGVPPWVGDDHVAVLAFLATATPEELGMLGEEAWWALDKGAWQGVRTDNGGWVDGPPADEWERSWREVARRFWERAEGGDFTLDEGMLLYAGWDLARQLAWQRGWCPGTSRKGPRDRV